MDEEQLKTLLATAVQAALVEQLDREIGFSGR
jgi:hypothetical protein